MTPFAAETASPTTPTLVVLHWILSGLPDRSYERLASRMMSGAVLGSHGSGNCCRHGSQTVGHTQTLAAIGRDIEAVVATKHQIKGNATC